MKKVLCQITLAILNVSHMYICSLANLCGSVEDVYCQDPALVFSVGNVWAYSHSLSITGTRILSDFLLICKYAEQGFCMHIGHIWTMHSHINMKYEKRNFTIFKKFKLISHCAQSCKDSTRTFFLKMFTWTTKAAYSLRTCGHSWPGQRL